MSQDNRLDNKRVAKNTVVLYFRTIVTLCISLYTSRAILNILGVEDFGVYNVVGGFVSMFAIISSTLISATQRYLNFELGKLDDNHSKEVFNAAIAIHGIICLTLFVLFETIGLWFLNGELNISNNRIVAANWLFQFSIVTFMLNIMRSPFDASIIAHERMVTFAYTNILEAVLKLVVIYVLLLPFGVDNLILYGFLMMCISLLVFLIYWGYCRRNFDEIRFQIVSDKSYYKGMLGFAGYNFVGAASTVFSQQGVNMLLNVFFGVTLNAARGVTDQVNHAITKFVNDFTLALNPQITKSYAQGNISNMMNLIYKGTKISFLLFLFFSVPIIAQTPLILKLWLKIVPDYAILFVRLSLIDALINTMAGPISIGAMATGNIKKMSLWIGSIRFMVFPLSYIAFKIGAEPYYAYLILIVCDLILFYVRLHIACWLLKVDKWPYISNVLFKVFPIVVLAFSTSYIVNKLVCLESFAQLLLYSIFLCTVTVVFSIYVSFNRNERTSIYQMIRNKKCKT